MDCAELQDRLTRRTCRSWAHSCHHTQPPTPWWATAASPHAQKRPRGAATPRPLRAAPPLASRAPHRSRRSGPNRAVAAARMGQWPASAERRLQDRRRSGERLQLGRMGQRRVQPRAAGAKCQVPQLVRRVRLTRPSPPLVPVHALVATSRKDPYAPLSWAYPLGPRGERPAEHAWVIDRPSPLPLRVRAGPGRRQAERRGWCRRRAGGETGPPAQRVGEAVRAARRVVE
jgi:hypothetical protein